MKLLPFANTNILVTRPALHAKALSKQIALLGGNPVEFATVTIKSLESKLPEISQFTAAIFVSKHAVFYGLSYIKRFNTNIENFIAIGKSTATELQNNNIKNVIYPNKLPYNSHELLKIEQLQNVKNENIIIFRGEHGLDLIAKTLKQRGANIHNAMVYKQCCPTYDDTTIKQKLDTNKLDFIIITSSLGLENLLKLASIEIGVKLLAVPILVVSERLAKEATSFGFNTVITAIAADDQSIVSALTNWRLKELQK